MSNFKLSIQILAICCFMVLSIIGILEKNWNFGLGINVSLVFLYLFLYIQPIK